MQLASRTMAANNAIEGSVKDCSYYVSQVPGASAEDTCATYNFSNLTDLQYFVNATWYGDLYKDSFMTATGWNTTQFDAFFDASTTNSFGNVLASICNSNAVAY